MSGSFTHSRNKGLVNKQLSDFVTNLRKKNLYIIKCNKSNMFFHPPMEKGLVNQILSSIHENKDLYIIKCNKLNVRFFHAPREKMTG